MVQTEIVNVVAAGSFHRELDVRAIAEDIETAEIRSPDADYSHSVAYLRKDEDSPLVTIFTSGSFHITSAETTEDIEQAADWAISSLGELGLELDSVSYEVKNVVAMANLKRELNLPALAMGLGLEQVEYEPEQFPGLIYRPSDYDAVTLLFASGKIIITGVTTPQSADRMGTYVEEQIQDIFDD